MSAPTLSVIVVSWMNREHIAACLDSIERSAGSMPVESWVVDNASTDGTADLVAARSPAVRLIRNRDNVGFARAVNQALSVAGGRYLLLLNPDTELVGSALVDMVAFMDAHPEAGIAGCRVENADGSLQRGCRRLLPTPRRMLWRLSGLAALFPRSATFSEYTLTHLPEDRTAEVEAVSGSFLMIRRETLARVGPMDESFFMYGEDLDWCARVGAAGEKVLYHPGARVIHHLGQSSRKNRSRTIRALHEAGAIYYRKHLAPSTPPIVNAVVLLALRLRCALVLGASKLTASSRRRNRIEPAMEGTALVRNLR